jgi:hypothetical protein
MKVLVYVEGPSDKVAMLALLEPLLDLKRQKGIAIEFFPAPEGDKKHSVLTKVPKKAVNIILNNPYAIVVAMPDLYPKNVAFPHETFEDMAAGILKNFEDDLRSKQGEVDLRLKERFKVFCFKHDLEALLLTCEEGLKSRLGVTSLPVSWQKPVEDQNHNHPPKRIVERMFELSGDRYQGTIDAPLILGTERYQDVADLCPQCFKPFVDFLTDLSVDAV